MITVPVNAAATSALRRRSPWNWSLGLALLASSVVAQQSPGAGGASAPATPAPLAAMPPVPPLPPLHPPRAHPFDLQHVALDLRFDWRARQARGTATLTLTPTVALSQLALDAGQLTIESVTRVGGGALGFVYDGGAADDGLVIALERRYRAGEPLTLRIAYHTNWVNQSDPNNLWGSYGKGLRFFTPTSSEPRQRLQLWSMGQPQGNRYWFPGYDSPDDLRTTELTATVPLPLMAISNGDLIDTRDNHDGTRSYHWLMDQPYANDLTSIVVGEYVDLPQQVDGVAIHHYAYPDEVDAVKATVVRLPEMLRFFSQKIGVPYPYRSYSQVFVQDFPGGMEHITVATQTDNMVDDARTHADYFYLWDRQEAQQLAHQWFGNLLSCRDWGEIWLSQGFAQYFDALFSEQRNGRENFLLFHLQGDFNTYLADWAAGVRHPVVTRHYDDIAGFITDNTPSVRGAAFLHLLRKHLGDERWWAAIHRYVSTHAHGRVSTEDFRQAVERSSGENLDWFFDQWLYRMGHPVFEIVKRYDAATQQLVLEVRQLQQADATSPYPQVRYFQGAVDIEIDERIERVWLEPKAVNTLRFAAAREPLLVNFDFESSWVKELTFKKSLDELLYQLRHDRDVVAQRWAMRELVAQVQQPGVAAADRERVAAALREMADSGAYWRLRAVAITQLQALTAAPKPGQAIAYDEATMATLLTVARKETSWLRSVALAALGESRRADLADVYLQALQEPSHPVIYAAAVALGKSRSPKAFEPLTALVQSTSWKGENKLSGLDGLRELGDPRGVRVALQALQDLNAPHWKLTTPWDFRINAVQTLVALGKGAAAYPIVAQRLRRSLAESELSDIFNEVLLIATLGDPRARETFAMLRQRFKGDANALQALAQYETQWTQALPKT